MDDGIALFLKEIQKEHDAILRDATKRVKNSLVRLSPVDEGQFVSEWDVAVNQFPVDLKPPFDPKKRKTRARLQGGIDNIVMGDVVYFENQDPAATMLEFGFSGQAPQGVVRLTARRWRKFVQGAARAAQNRVKKRIVTTP